MSEPLPDNFTEPVCQALTTPLLMGGVPRNFFFLNLALTIFAVPGLHWWWYLAVGFGIHFGAKAFTRHDPYWLEILVRALLHESFYEV